MKKNYCLLIGICILCLRVDIYAQTIIRGPYLQSGTPNSMVIKWRTNTPTSSRVWYGNNPSNLAFSQTVNGDRTDHEVKVSGLPANSTFYYSVGNSAGQLMAPTGNHYFRTSPLPGATQTIKAWVLGDAGKATDNQRNVRDAFYNFHGNQHIDMILLLGDNAYESGTDAEYQAAMFENMYENRLINSVVWPSFGNHDGESAFSATQTGPYYEIFTAPTNGEAGGVPSGTEAYYSFDYGNIHIVVLDSDDSGRDPGDPQLAWLEADLAATNQEWKVVIFHHPPYSLGDSDTNAKETDMRQYIAPILEAYNVDLVLAGHSHTWQRSYLINGHYGLSNSWNPATMGIDLGDGRQDGDGPYMQDPQGKGTVYIVSGSAGSRGSVDEIHPVMYRSLSEMGSMYFEVAGSRMDIKFIRDDGVIDDYLSITKQAPVGAVPTVSVTAPANGTHYDTPQTITITADAADSDGAVTQVEFLANGISIGLDNQAPWSVSYTIPDEGLYDIMAIATDNDANTAQSASVLFTVGPVSTCSRIGASTDDAEEGLSGAIDLTSSDLELVTDGPDVQMVGMRFNGLGIPQGATIQNAYLRFTVDENTNDNPCNLTIYGEAADNAQAFSAFNYNISGRQRTAASVSWMPSDWLSVGDAGPAQQSPDLASVIQEIVNRPGFTNNSSIAILIEGTGKRTAESFDGVSSSAPELCIEFTTAPPSYDCPALSANIGDACDDGDNTTLNDMVDASCNCAGTPTACTNIGDDDGDGVCADVDCNDNDPTVGSNANDGDCDGVPTTEDCDDTNPAIGSNANDMDCDGVPAGIDCDDNDPAVISTNADDADCDGVPTAEDCDDNDPTVTSTNTGDADCDGVPSTIDCDDNDASITSTNVNDADCDGVPTAEDCNDNDPAITTTNSGDADCDGVPAAQDCDDNDPAVGSNANDMDCDGVPTGIDCNDNDASVVSTNVDDADCDGVPTPEDCDDNDPTVTSTNTGDADCDGVPAGIDCDDNDASVTSSNVGDADCDGVPTTEDCDDTDPSITTTNTTDGDCDGVPATVDCNDNDPGIAYQPGDVCDDGNPDTYGETIQADCSCGGGVATPTSTCSAVNSSSDDAEERSSGRVSLNSNDLRLAEDSRQGSQTVGLRFTNLSIPRGAQVTSAFIQFTADEASNGAPCNLILYGQAADDAPTFANIDFDVSSRPRTGSSVSWAPPQWLAAGNAGAAQRTPDLSEIVQEIVNRSGYSSASSIAIIIEGDGVRVAESGNSPSGAPRLCVEYFHSPPPFDCPGLSAYFGSPCDDGDNTTLNDTVDNDCNCTGTPTACTGKGDDDGDGVCSDVDCDDNDPTITYGPGDACDDGNMATVNDVYDANCNCAGTFNPCPGADDADGDGICSDVDCNDNDPTITSRIGDACDDGDPDTYGETIQADCSCGGGVATPTSVCSSVDRSSDDAEEVAAAGSVDLANSDLELCTDRNNSQIVGLRFNNLNIPQGANIVSAYLQFMVDENRNDDPCSLTLYGQASDNAATFTAGDFNISSRPRTSNSASWSPPQWLTVGEAGPAQQSVNIASIIQEVVSRSGYTSGSSIAIIIEGTGRRVAESFDSPGMPARLCIEFFASPPDYDCPTLSAFVGGPCDDGDNTTVDDTVDGDCNCSGTPTVCTGIGDNDGDGICFGVDCDDNDASVTTQVGGPCDDGNPSTVNDVFDANCVCAGTLNTCPLAGDDDGDGICSDVDCNDNDPTITSQAGDPCDDGDPNTFGETIQADCSCGGGNLTPTQSCAIINDGNDDAEEELDGTVTLNSNDLELVTDPRNGAQVIGVRFNGLNIPQGAVITNAYVQFTVDEAANDNPCSLTIYGQASDDASPFTGIDFDISARPRTNAIVNWMPAEWLTVGEAGPAQQTPGLAAIIQEIVGRGGYTAGSSIALIIEGTGRRTAESANGPPNGVPELCVEYLAPAMANRPLSPPVSGIMDRENSNSIPPVRAGDGGWAGSLIVYPNPAKESLTVAFDGFTAGPVQVLARDINGRTVIRETWAAQNGKNAFILDGLSLPDGVYFLQLFNDTATQSAKFIISKD